LTTLPIPEIEYVHVGFFALFARYHAAPGELSLRGGCNLNRDVAELLRSADFRVVELERFALSGVPKTIGSHFVGSAVAA
jgi:hypothetical protein